MVIVMVYYIIMPWLFTLECVRAQYNIGQYTSTAQHKIKDIDRGKKKYCKELEGKLVNKVLDGSGYSNCSWFFPKSHILTIRFLLKF